MNYSSVHMCNIAQVSVERRDTLKDSGTGVITIRLIDDEFGSHYINIHTVGDVAITGDIELPETEAEGAE